jgi:hypothetical protein
MPTFTNAKVLSSTQIWASPDGQRKIYELNIQLDTGQTVTAKSYSDRLTTGFVGDIETYEKPGRNGVETFAKQAPKEGGFTPGGGGFKGGGAKPMADPFTMYLSYAKDIAVAMIAKNDVGQLDEKKFGEVLAIVLKGGHTLHDGRPGAEPQQAQLDTPAAPDTVHDVKDEPIRLEDIPF